jgi:hydroxyethylthiazole kinase-like uncharacterized protein yjeF
MPHAPVSTSLYTAAQVRAIDAAAIEQHGIPGFDLMQRAAWSAFDLLRRRWPHAHRICVLCGPGNNGGDGYLLAVLAHEAGLDVQMHALGEQRAGDALRAREAWLKHGIEQVLDLALPLLGDVIVDALFGTGLGRPLEGASRAAVEAINASGLPVLSLDVPSGLCSDTGSVLGAAVNADATISFVAWKRGLFTLDGPDHVGALSLSMLDLPESVHPDVPHIELLAWPQIRDRLPRRKQNSHKGKFGHVLALGGDTGMAGAIRLAAEAALRVGAGLVSVGTRAQHATAINTARPEVMVHAIDGPQDSKAMLDRATVLAVGPGLGTRAWGHAHWRTALDCGLPMVLDADALNLLAREKRDLPPQCVLTPHPGEAARLLGTDIPSMQADRFASAREIARRYTAVVVLKGVGSLIAAPDGRAALCPWGNPGMASGGMGDVLTGVIAGLLAQRLDAWDAACLGVALHARAGDAAARARGQRGLLASDLFDALQRELDGDGIDV